MRLNKQLTSATFAFAIALGLSGSAFAQAAHGHDSHSAPAIEIKLDNGQKWQTDEALRTGMIQIRTALAASLPQIHQGRFTAAEFAALADRVQEHVDYVVANCKLPEEADLQLHGVLVPILDGVNAMKGAAGQEQGAVAVVLALNAYGEHFEHPGWQPVKHQ